MCLRLCPVSKACQSPLYSYIKSGSIMNKQHFPEVLSLLRLDSDAIARTATRLDAEQVEYVINLLSGCGGKVVVLGVGKSGIIAQKIAATMTSTGTAAVYLLPSDALHGGLGIVTSDDV